MHCIWRIQRRSRDSIQRTRLHVLAHAVCRAVPRAMDRDRQIMLALARRRIEEQEQEERMLKEGRKREEAEKRRRLQRTAAATAGTATRATLRTERST